MAVMGRPRTFDRDKAVEQAMYIFWQNGYESTSLNQLKAGIANGIFCAELLCCIWLQGGAVPGVHAALPVYLCAGNGVPVGHGSGSARCHRNGSAPVGKDAVRARAPERLHGRSGCHERAIRGTCRRDRAVDAFARTDAGRHHDLRAARYRQWRTTHRYRCPALATVFDAFLLGLSTLARDGVRYIVMDTAITQVMSVWDASRTRRANRQMALAIALRSPRSPRWHTTDLQKPNS